MEALGTDLPFGTLLDDWLWQRKEDLPGMLLLVPTAQSGRRIRQKLAERGGALAPKIVTPSFFLQVEGGAPEAVEILAWVEVLESIVDWSEYAEAFPEAPHSGETRARAGWAMSLARSLTGVRAGLVEGGFMMHSAATRLENSLEAERWQDLARLEALVEQKLADWGYQSRNALVTGHEFSWPASVNEVVLVGMVDLFPSIISILNKAPVPVKIVVADGEGLDEWGKPGEGWTEREIPWPHVALAGDAGQQAELALEAVSAGGRPSDQVTLGSVDEEVSAELVRAFGRAGWAIHNPGSQRAPAVVPWLSAWRQYLARSESAEVMDLLTFQQTGRLVKHRRLARSRALSRLRNNHLVRTSDDVTRVRILLEKEYQEAGESPRAQHLAKAVADALLTEETMAELEDSRDRFLRNGFHAGMEDLLEIIDPERGSGIEEWLVQMKKLAELVKRPASFWLELLQLGLPFISDPPPEDRVLDVYGWLELFQETGEHLVICGMNEGLVPSRASTDSWLPEATRRLLDLSTDSSRHARDAYLLICMMKAREASGQVSLLLGKSSGSGDILQPSRLLLAAKGSQLAGRVRELFQEVSPPEDGLSWGLGEAWKWKLSREDRPEKLSVTGFSDYLACPFRFYLKHVKKMQTPESERGEWNARDFGNLMHLVLESFGRNEAARELSQAEGLEEWLHQELEKILEERFGSMRSAALRIQQEVMAQRLTWFACRQALEYREGWRITEVERSFELPIGGITVRGQIDRIERHVDSGRCRVLDYKTSSQAKNVANAHGTELRANFEWPEHLKDVAAVKTILPVGRGEKMVEARWTNLQVALYAAAFGSEAEVGYFALGASESQVKLSMWPDFGGSEIQSALSCAEWVASQVLQAPDPFWPPAAKVRYDDYDILRFDKEMKEVVR